MSKKPPKQLNETAIKALHSFAHAASIHQQRNAVLALVQLKSLDAARIDPHFDLGLRRLVEFSAQGSPHDAAEALALAMRIAASAKSVNPTIPKLFAAALSNPVGSARNIHDPKDRQYLSKALAFASGEWVIPHLALEAVIEEDAEKARRSLLEALLKHSASVSLVLEALADGFRSLTIETADPAKSRASRLQRVLIALRLALVKTEVAAGGHVGKALKALLKAAIGSYEIKSSALRGDIALVVLGTLSDIVRLHFSLSAEAETYAVIADIRALFLPGGWPDRVARSVRVIADQIEEAITLLAKQGIADNLLRNQLNLLLGEVAARRRLESLSVKIEGLDPIVHRWLTGSSPPRAVKDTPIAVEAQLGEMDRRVAALYRDAVRAGEAIDQIILHDDAPRLPQTTEVLVAMRRINELIISLAINRGLRLRGTTDTLVQFLPGEHDLGSNPIGSRLVRIVRPLVERDLPHRRTEIILKADVEPA